MDDTLCRNASDLTNNKGDRNSVSASPKSKNKQPRKQQNHDHPAQFDEQNRFCWFCRSSHCIFHPADHSPDHEGEPEANELVGPFLLKRVIYITNDGHQQYVTIGEKTGNLTGHICCALSGLLLCIPTAKVVCATSGGPSLHRSIGSGSPPPPPPPPLSPIISLASTARLTHVLQLCAYCKKEGGVLFCAKSGSGCSNASYHIGCAIDAKFSFDRMNLTLFCPKHTLSAKKATTISRNGSNHVAANAVSGGGSSKIETSKNEAAGNVISSPKTSPSNKKIDQTALNPEEESLPKANEEPLPNPEKEEPLPKAAKEGRVLRARSSTILQFSLRNIPIDISELDLPDNPSQHRSRSSRKRGLNQNHPLLLLLLLLLLPRLTHLSRLLLPQKLLKKLLPTIFPLLLPQMFP